MEMANNDGNGIFRTVMAKIAACATAMLLVCAGALGGGNALADYYKYTDKSGAVCITNDPDAVPPKYRAAMKIIREETLAKKDKGARKESAEVPSVAPEAVSPPQEQKNAVSEEPASTFGRLAARFPWFKPLVIVSAILAGLFLVRKLSSLLSSALFARVIYLAFFLGVFIFAYVSYAGHVTDSYFTIKKKVLAMFEKANRREMTEPGEIPPSAAVKDQSPR